MKSIRHDLIRSLRSTLVAVLLAEGVIAYWCARSILVSEFDNALAVRGRALASLVEFEHGEIIFEFAPTLLPEFERPSKPDYYEVWTAAGGVVDRSRSLGDGHLDHPKFVNGKTEQIYDLTLPDGRPGRAVSIAFVSRLDEELEDHPPPNADAMLRATIVMATSRTLLDNRLRWLIQGIALMEGCVLIAVLWIVRSRVRAGLAPLDRFATDVARIDADNLDQRVAADDHPVELVGVSERLNELIERLQSAFQRERRFTSAAAHELRTPIAELRALAEVSSKWSHKCSEDDHLRAFADVRDISFQMDRLVQSLLAIARSADIQDALSREAVELESAVKAAVQVSAEAARAKHIAWEIDVGQDAVAWTNRDCLRLILRNLLENAVEYSPEQSTVGILARVEERGIVLSISNENTALADADIPRLFEPFWRKDEARTSSGHSGLGLAVVETLAKALGVTVAARLRDSRTLVIELTLPACTEAGVIASSVS